MDLALNTLQRLQSQVDKEDWYSVINECSNLLPEYPNSPVLWNVFGLGHMRVGNFSGAKMAFAEAISLKADFAAAYLNHGILCRALGQFEEALSSFLCAKIYDKKNADLLNDIGNLLIEMGKTQDAISYLKQSVELSPDISSFKFNLANAFKIAGECDQAEVFYREAIKLDPTNIQFRDNFSIFLEDIGRFGEARLEIEKALAIAPGNPRLFVNLAHMELRDQKFVEGWSKKRAYWKSDDRKEPKLDTRKPQWSGQKVDRLFVWAEQGIGDQIMYASCFNEITSICRDLTVSVSQRLLPLFKRSFPSNITFLDKTYKLEDEKFDFHAPGMTALGLLRQDVEAFANARKPFLVDNQEQTRMMREHLSLLASGKPIVGVSWFTNSARNGFMRSIEITELVGLIPQDIFLVNLQYGNVRSDIDKLAQHSNVEIFSFPKLDITDDLDGLASLIMACDEIVSVDNSVVHLAGALGKRTNALLPFGSDWRWGTRKNGSNLWYQSVHLNRQPSYGDWDGCVKQIKFGVS